MTEALRRFVEPVRVSHLAGALATPAAQHMEDVGHAVDLAAVDGVVEEKLPGAAGPSRAAWDSELAEPLYSSLQHVPRRILADMRVWHWLCVARFPRFVWLRWLGEVPEDPAALLERRPAMRGRFLGAESMAGVSRNALARIYWGTDALVDQDGDCSLARQCLTNQDLYQAIFERELGLYPPAARACVRVFADRGQGVWREPIRALNHYLTTTAVEALSEDEIIRFLEQ